MIKNIWKFQMCWAFLIASLEWILFIMDISDGGKFPKLTLIWAVAWTLWALYATIRYWKDKPKVEKMNIFLNNDFVDESLLDKIEINKIEEYIRKRKLKNILK